MYVRIPEKRFWKPGLRHRVRSIEFIAVGPEARAMGMPALYSLRAFTQCGEVIPFAELIEAEEGGRLCKRCDR